MKKVRASMMNAIHDLPLLVARDEGFFQHQGLDVEIIRTPGSGQRNSDHRALRANVFDRTMEALYDQGACDQFRMCEWGVMKRAVESNVEAGPTTRRQCLCRSPVHRQGAAGRVPKGVAARCVGRGAPRPCHRMAPCRYSGAVRAADGRFQVLYHVRANPKPCRGNLDM